MTYFQLRNASDLGALGYSLSPPLIRSRPQTASLVLIKNKTFMIMQCIEQHHKTLRTMHRTTPQNTSNNA